MPAVIYARKSTDRDDRQAQSLDDQVKVLRELARREGILVSEVITESKSAKTPGARPEFQRLIAQIEAGTVDSILTWSANRLSRNLVDGGIVAHLLQTGKLKWIRTPERTHLPEDNAILLSVENGMATNYLQELSRNVRRGVKGKVERGWRPGKVPVGYINNPVTREIDTDTERFVIVKKGWDLFLTGNYTPVEIHRQMASWGLRTTAGRQFGHTTIYAILRNPFYSGALPHKGQMHKGRHVPMVTPAQFEIAQQLLRGLPKRRPVRHHHAFAGVLRCAVCGCSVVGETKRKPYRATGRVATYTYYHCSGWKGCPKRSVSESTIRLAILEAAAKVAIDPEFADLAQRALRDAANTARPEHESSKESLRKAAEGVSARLRRARDLLLDGSLTPAEYAEVRADLEIESSNIQREVREATRDAARIDLEIARRLDVAGRARGAEAMDAGELRALSMGFGGERFLNLGKVTIVPDPILKQIATFSPLVLGSQSRESGTINPDFSLWSRVVKDLRKVARAQLQAHQTLHNS